jgi:hypothetical protein
MTDTLNLSIDLVQALSQFNRKERYWLLRNALGHYPSQSEVPVAPLLSDGFCTRLEEHLKCKIPVTAWWAMDYHLDWLYAATQRLKNQNKELPSNELDRDGNRAVQGNQEDIDFVIAFDKTLILIEVKGDTSWSNEQLSSKKFRLEFIFDGFGADFKPLAGIDKAIYLLMSPEKINWKKDQDTQKGLSFKSLPRGVSSENVWLPLVMSDDLFKVKRCTDKGLISRSGEYWKVEKISKSKSDKPGEK